MNGKNKQWRLIVGAVLLALLASACAMFAPEEAATEEPVSEIEHDAADSAEKADEDTSGEVMVEPSVEEAAEEPLEEAPAAPEGRDESSAGAVEAESEAFTDVEAGGLGGGPDMAGEEALPMATQAEMVPPDDQFSPLQAGEIDDNEDFGEYLQYRLDFAKFLGYPVSDVDVTERHIIQVTNQDGLPVLGANIFVYAGQEFIVGLRTTATGRAYFFPRAYPNTAGVSSFDVSVEKGRDSKSLTITRENTDAVWPVTLNASSSTQQVQLDVLFLLDATGSMGDEIDQLKENILSISAQIEALPSRPDVRFGLVYYRDRGDAYVVRSTDFTGNINSFQRELRDVRAEGGGDSPESMNEALHVAVEEMNWRVEDTVSMAFLVADAPPHLDYTQDYDYGVEMMNAAEMGIKIFPIGSRLDGEDAYQKQAEYILRQIGQFTGGHFIFLTYEDTPQSSGEPGTEYSVPEESYSVEDLDALVVRLVQEELAALAGEQQ